MESAAESFRMRSADPVFWPIREVIAAFRTQQLSPVELAQQVIQRIDLLDPLLHSYLSLSPEQALAQARRAESEYRQPGTPAPLLGIPISIKDLFDVEGEATTLGSRAYGTDVAQRDSVPVQHLRRAGSVFIGKSNTAEFGQSATTGNLLGPDCGNPWDPQRTSGGSSGGAAAGVAAGLASAALGSDGGGSIRIPAAMCGLFGLKPTFSGTPQEDSFHAMTHFVCSGPITRTVDDARAMLAVLLERSLERTSTGRLRIGWCPSPLDKPVDPGIREVLARAIQFLPELGHQVEIIDLPLEGWADAFGPLVLADEWNYRRHLLDQSPDSLTSYVRKGIEAGAAITADDVERALVLKEDIASRVSKLLSAYDVIATPTTACTAFLIDERPTEIDGFKVDPLWGPFPFTAPFNVSGNPAASIPVGLSGGLPVGLQLVAPHGREDLLLDLCEEVEESVAFPRDIMEKRWSNLPELSTS